MSGSPDLEEWLCKGGRIRPPMRHVSFASGSNTCRFTTRSTSTPNLASVKPKKSRFRQKVFSVFLVELDWFGLVLMLLQES